MTQVKVTIKVPKQDEPIVLNTGGESFEYDAKDGTISVDPRHVGPLLHGVPGAELGAGKDNLAAAVNAGAPTPASASSASEGDKP